MNEQIENFKDKRWTDLVESFKKRIEEDKIVFNCKSVYVKLPEICPKPEYLLIGMEPGPGDDLDKDPEYCNFIASKEDFIIHYCAYYYLGNEGFNYQMTDMAKGGISIKNAELTRDKRYEIWLPYLKKELLLFGNPKIIFIGKGLYNAWNSKFFTYKREFILQHGGSARGHVKNYYNKIKNIEKYRPDDKVKQKMKDLAVTLMEMQNYSSNLKNERLKIFDKDFTEQDKILLSVYRYDFERF